MIDQNVMGIADELIEIVYMVAKELSKEQWSFLNSRIEMLYQKEAAKVRLDSSDSDIGVLKALMK